MIQMGQLLLAKRDRAEVFGVQLYRTCRVVFCGTHGIRTTIRDGEGNKGEYRTWRAEVGRRVQAVRHGWNHPDTVVGSVLRHGDNAGETGRHTAPMHPRRNSTAAATHATTTGGATVRTRLLQHPSVETQTHRKKLWSQSPAWSVSSRTKP